MQSNPHPPVLPEQVLAHFSKGMKGTRLKAMAQEIAMLANRQSELIEQVKSLENMIATAGGQEVLDFSNLVESARNDLQQAQDELSLVQAERAQLQEQVQTEHAAVLEDASTEAEKTLLAAQRESEKIVKAAESQAKELIHIARQDIRKERARIERQAVADAQQKIDTEIERGIKKLTKNRTEIAEKQAEEILAQAKADAFRVANSAWIKARREGNIPPAGLLVAHAAFKQELAEFGEYSGAPGKFIFHQEHSTSLRDTKPYLENCIELAGKPAVPGSSVSRSLLGNLTPRYFEDTGDPARTVSLDVDGKIIGWMRQRESEYYREFLLLLNSLEVEAVVQCEIKISSSEKRGALSAQVTLELFPAVPIQRRMPRLNQAVIAMSKKYPSYDS